MSGNRRAGGRTEIRLFILLVFALYVSQIFIVVPGTNLDSANYGQYNTITLLGLSYSSWLSLIIICWCLLRIFFSLNRIRLTRPALLCTLALLAFILVGAVNSSLSGLFDLGIKTVMPFVMFLYVRYVLVDLDSRSIDSLLLAVNLFLIGQVLFCKVATGEFSANHYYTYIMDEEYFGYYNSPHPFTAMLGLLSIWNLRIIALKQAPVLNVALVAGNVALIVASGVRTYLLGLVFATVFLMVMALFRPELKRFRIFIIIALFALVLLGGDLVAVLSGTRLSSSYNTTELSSGRFLRWTLDMGAYWSGNAYEILFGGGFSHSYDVNSALIGVSINSLNFIVDLLLDNGVLGLVALMTAYAGMLADLKRRGNGPFFVALLIYLLTGMFINNLLPYITVTLAAVLILVAWNRDGLSLQKGQTA